MGNSLLTQAELEEQMFDRGRERASNSIQAAEEKGQAHRNPYAKTILANYVLPLAETIRTELKNKAAGVRQAHVALLHPLDPDAVAYFAVRSVVSALLGAPLHADKARSYRTIGYDIGRVVHQELVLVQIEAEAPELYHTLARDLSRRLSKNERHRSTVMRLQAKKKGIDWVEWDIGARHQVGLWLLDCLIRAGMVYLMGDPTIAAKYKNQVVQVVMLSDEIIAHVDRVKSYTEFSSPMYGPCVEPPLPWGKDQVGGFHTRRLQRTHNMLVRCHGSVKDIYREADMPKVYAAANTLQSTRWQVNRAVLEVISEVGKVGNRGEIVTAEVTNKPDPPSWLNRDTDPDSLSPEQTVEFKRWKRSVAEWFTEKKLSAAKYSRFYAATRAARMYLEYEAIHFVYFADTRGRLYPMTYGLNPQGSDLQRGLLRFADGLPLSTPDAVKWFKVQGANKYGFDKGPLSGRVAWVDERAELLENIGHSPLEFTEWMSAENPIQFLAWCIEFSCWLASPTDFVSHLPVSMDGSCNGLQNLSALLRDEVGGKATNLTANTEQEDIYRRVAEAATLRAQGHTDSEIMRKWLAHGINRSLVKRAVMTTPYGVTKRTAQDYIIADYLREGKAPEFGREDWRSASSELMNHVWPAIGDVVIKGREAMDYLRRASRLILLCVGAGEPVVRWTSPSGFPGTQAYFQQKIHRINTRLAGQTKIRVFSETEDPDNNRHANGMAPNFVHSLDAAHLHLTTVAMAEAGVTNLAMIHDDFGTHAANAETLFRVIREQFVEMYETNDPLAQLRERYPYLPEPPSRGSLDIREVLRSEFFFA